MKKLLSTLILALALPIATAAKVEAYGSTNMHLEITPRLCIVDVVQDGNNQIVQTPSSGCEAALPILLADPVPATPAASPLFALPFAGRESHSAQPLLRPQVEGTLAPLASRGSQMTKVESTRLPMAVVGVSLAVLATAIGLDIALFELHYSRSIAKWTKNQTAGRVFKR